MSLSVYTAPPMPMNEQDRERELARSGLPGRDAAGGLDRIVADARHHLRTRMAIVTIVSGDSAHVIAATGLATGVYRRHTSICGHAILAPDRLFVVPDTVLDPRFAGNPFVDRPDGVRFYAAAVLVSNGFPIGTLCVFDACPRPGLRDGEAFALQRLGMAAVSSITGPRS